MRWKFRTRDLAAVPRLRTLAAGALLALALAVAATGCGSDTQDDAGPGRPFTPLPTGETTVGAGEIGRLDGTPIIVVRTLPVAAISAEQLAPAGRGQAADGGTIDLARASVAQVATWEYVSAADDGWRVWRPAIIDGAMEDAGPGARLADVTEEDWPDSCYGLARQDEVCLTVITRGYRVIVEQGGKRIEYHTARVSGFRRVTDPQGD